MQLTSDKSSKQNKLVKKVIKFRKGRYAWTPDGDYAVVAGCSFITIANDLCQRYNGYLVTFKETDFWHDYKCKLIVRIPQDKWMKFVSDWVDIFGNKIEKMSWSRA